MAKGQSANNNTKTITDKIDQLDREVEWFYGEDFQLSEAVEKYQADKSASWRD